MSAERSDLEDARACKADLEEMIVNMDEPPPQLHLNMAEIYRSRLAASARHF